MSGMTGVDLSELTEAHARRLFAVDRLLPVPAIPQSDDGDELFGVEVDGTVAVGVARNVDLDPDSMGATVGALRQHRLAVQISGPAADRAVDLLLTEWDAYLIKAARHGDPDSAAVIDWPSRDTAAVGALTRHGFTAAGVCAVRPGGRPTHSFADVRIRAAKAADLDVAAGFHLDLIDYDAQFGLLTRRAGTPARVRTGMTAAIDRPRTGVWLAERAGEPVGLISVAYPDETARAARLVSAESIGFVDCMYVRPDVRGGGIGSALVRWGHLALDDAGVEVTMLYHALPNPRSTPFWYSHGYRPLWTIWQRRPVIR
ncbi:MAG TPA: GNAT family N-acetyltransferase [Pseudonocardiaceae bacterium]|nr:GNAT family N-acetyltransferase [Pseudonocardiaceae bacterium]